MRHRYWSVLSSHSPWLDAVPLGRQAGGPEVHWLADMGIDVDDAQRSWHIAATSLGLLNGSMFACFEARAA